MIKDTAGQSIGAQMINATTGAAFAGAVTVYVTGDAGVQALGSVGAGVCTNEGNGYFTYRPSQAETNYDLIAFTFVGIGAINVTIQVATLTAVQAAAFAGVAVGSGTGLTVREVCTDALVEIGVISGLDAPDPEDLDLALRWMRGMVDSFQGDGYLLYTTQRWTFPLVANQATRTIGDGAQFDIGQQRPMLIGHAGVIPVGDTVEIPLTPWSRQRLLEEPLKTLTDLWPHAINYEPTTALLGTLTFWPVPTTAATVAIAIPTPLVAIVDADTGLAFAPGGYEEAWRLSLAQRLQRPFKKPADPTLDEQARLARSVIRRLNDQGPPPARSDPGIAGRGGYDIRSNQYRSG